MPSSSQPRIAIVHDWLTNMAGAERVVLAMHEAFPNAPIYTSVYEPSKLPLFKGLDIRTTSLQSLPGPIRKLHKFFPTLRVRAFARLDLSEYDIILSSSSAESKQVVKSRQSQIHICYCHTPIRYYWSHYEEYKRDPGFGSLNWLIRLALPVLVPAARKADYVAAQKVDRFIANSAEVQKRIKKYYDKSSVVIHPPVSTKRFMTLAKSFEKRHHYVALGRQVPYKRTDLAVAACTRLNLPLVVIGNGPDNQRLRRIAGPTVTFETSATDERVAEILSSARGFIFPSEEDFGIVQVEALAAGTPVIAFGKGGALDIVEDGKTGVLFMEQSVDSVVGALERFDGMRFPPGDLQRVAKRFDEVLFVNKIRKIVSDYQLSN